MSAAEAVKMLRFIFHRKVCDTDTSSHDHARPPRHILMETVPQAQGVIEPERKRRGKK